MHRKIFVGVSYPVAPICMLGIFRYFGETAPFPFLLIIGSVLVAALRHGRDAGIASAVLVSIFMGFCHVAQLGPKTLIGSPFLVMGASLVCIGFAYVAGKRSDDHNADIEALRIARDKAEHSDQAKSQFVAMLSHELRTPIAAIIGFADLMQQEKDISPAHSSWLRAISRNANSLKTLVDELLDMSNIEAGRIPLRSESFGLGALALDTIRSVKIAADAKSLELISNVTIPDAIIVSDRLRIQQILQNLLQNGIRFTEVGEIGLNIHLSEDKQEIVFEVFDTGSGIAPREQSKIFEPFFKDDRHQYSLGIGLPLAKKLAHLLNGRLLLAKSIEGKGSRFEFRLPSTVMED